MAWMKTNEPKALAEAMKVAEDKIADEAKALQAHVKQEAFLHKLGVMAKYTPDVSTLERRQRWLLFVPDECMKAHRDNARLGNNAKIVAEAFTVDVFSLWKQRGEKIPMAIPLRLGYGKESLFQSPNVVARNPIRGELYFVNAQTLIKLDHHRENGVRFVREKVKVQIPTTKIQLNKVPLIIDGQEPVTTFVREETRVLGDPISVWMYVGSLEYWEPRLDNGHTFALVRRFKPHNPLLSTYYHFTPEEYAT